MHDSHLSLIQKIHIEGEKERVSTTCHGAEQMEIHSAFDSESVIPI